MRFWRVSGGTLLRTVTTGAAAEALAISPDRSIVAVEGSGRTFGYGRGDATIVVARA